MTSQVVINDVEPRTQAIALADQTVFNTNWTADATTDILVYSRASDVAADDQTQLVSSDDYNVEFVGTYETVRITFLVGRDVGDIVTIVRATPSDRENLYTNTNFVPSMLNQDFGILTLVDQQNQMYDQDFCPHYNSSCSYTDDNDLAIDLILPILEENQFWVKNNANTKIITATLPSGGTNLPNSGPFVTYTANALLTGAQDLGLLANGILQQSVVAGVATIESTITPYISEILDANGNLMLDFQTTPNAVNYIELVNNDTLNPPAILSKGLDADVGFTLKTKGAGNFSVNTTASIDAWYFATGDAYQHITNFTFANTLATREMVWPDISGTISIQTSGAWTPVDASGASLSLTATGFYTLIGNMMFAYADITYPVTANGSVAVVGGLPVLVSNHPSSNQGVLSYHNGATANKCIATGGTSNLAFYTAAGATITNAQMSNTVSYVLLIYPIS